MFARHIEPKLLGHLYVKAQGVIRRCCVNPIRPETLIERPKLKIGLVVEKNPGEAPLVFAEGDLPHPKIAPHGIHTVAPQIQADIKVVQERSFRRPQFRFGNRNPGLPARLKGCRTHFRAPIPNCDLKPVIPQQGWSDRLH